MKHIDRRFFLPLNLFKAPISPTKKITVRATPGSLLAAGEIFGAAARWKSPRLPSAKPV